MAQINGMVFVGKTLSDTLRKYNADQKHIQFTRGEEEKRVRSTIDYLSDETSKINTFIAPKSEDDIKKLFGEYANNLAAQFKQGLSVIVPLAGITVKYVSDEIDIVINDGKNDNMGVELSDKRYDNNQNTNEYYTKIDKQIGYVSNVVEIVGVKALLKAENIETVFIGVTDYKGGIGSIESLVLAIDSGDNLKDLSLGLLVLIRQQRALSILNDTVGGAAIKLHTGGKHFTNYNTLSYDETIYG